MDLSELTSFVEAHPDDHEQRWRLAKKLYMDCEYRQALEHLLILRDAWRPRVNMSRYIAATYYRLGRYDEALRELSSALQRWPDEIALHEQVARVYEVTDRVPQALEAWREIRRLNPDHPMADRAMGRLDALLSDDATDELPSGDSDSGIDISGVVCAVCGAQNSSEFSRCWQCHALLDERAAIATPAPDLFGTPRPHRREHSQRFLLAIAVIAAGVLALDIYLTLAHLAQHDVVSDHQPVLSLRHLLESEFAYTRVVLGLGLLALWPVSMWVALRIVELHGRTGAMVSAVVGLLAVSITYLTTWAPGLWFALAAPVGAMLTFALMWHFLHASPFRILGTWALQGALVIAAVLAGTVAMNGIGPLRDAPALLRFAQTPPGAGESGVYHAPDLAVNQPLHVAWETSGSAWLDTLPLTAQFVLTGAEQDKPLYVELLEGDRVRAGQNVDSPRVAFSESPIEPEKDYTLLLSGPEGTPSVTLRVYSLLRPVFKP